MIKNDSNTFVKDDTALKNVCNQLVTAILEANRKIANALLETFAEKHGFDLTVTEILEPSLERIGHMWEQTAQVSLAQGYVAGKIAEDFMTKMVERYGHLDLAVSGTERVGGDHIKKVAVIGNIEDDYHALGRKLVGTFLTMSGWQVHDLGNDVPAEEFVQTAIETNAQIIGASSMMYSSAMNIARVRDQIERQNLAKQIKLAVGGAVFRLRPELVHEVGGDGTAPNAVKAPALFDQLLVQLQ
ncbi:MAG: cobalamin-dependent protein [Desulfamplus sp.]|nr:cobalamin-dependent protein [Desulfamplus sp.]